MSLPKNYLSMNMFEFGPAVRWQGLLVAEHRSPKWVEQFVSGWSGVHENKLERPDGASHFGDMTLRSDTNLAVICAGIASGFVQRLDHRGEIRIRIGKCCNGGAC